MNRVSRGLLDVTLVVVAVLAVAAALWSAWLRSAVRSSPSTYRPGEHLEVSGLALSGDHRDTLLVWLNTRCQPCIESVPLYRVLSAHGRHASVVLMSQEPLETIELFVRQHGLTPDRVLSAGDAPLRFPGTPVLLLLDSDLIVKAAWVGRIIDSRTERLVTDAVR